ncbi:MAG: hypothetical protein NUW01_03470 [Gemmatimonadaceae bacterium]|nr:hypothetical protein [Gemmatimonadaceae bacterium]
MAFSDSIETTFLTSIYVTRKGIVPDSAGNYTTAATTVTSGVKGDIQAARPSAANYRQTPQGADYRITHMGFFDLPSTLPVEGDVVVDASSSYAVRNVMDWSDHLELDLERLGQ